MHPLESVLKVKGSGELSRSELVGLLTFKLRLMGVGEAKEAISKWIEEGLLIEEGDLLRINIEALARKEGEEDLFREMLSFVASQLGLDESEVLDELEEFSRRYGNLDRRLVLYLFGVEKGLDMSRFRDRLELD
ncbi:DUF2240 family protein [Thermococcus sp. AM4]|uniref:DUF2240 family protein n=1 Tax=Thermococcus sp. (strain AM4) TaxID=246969 RepID=UPI0001870F87|nr:DUF2240 family protein [Thermococcus sp. AM4]EEB73338.1 conserved hypothetical protein [Thermococcus sp. AM4]